MLLGAKTAAHTDHKNLTQKLSQFTAQLVMCWHLLLEEWDPLFCTRKEVKIASLMP